MKADENKKWLIPKLYFTEDLSLSLALSLSPNRRFSFSLVVWKQAARSGAMLGETTFPGERRDNENREEVEKSNLTSLESKAN